MASPAVKFAQDPCSRLALLLALLLVIEHILIAVVDEAYVANNEPIPALHEARQAQGTPQPAMLLVKAAEERCVLSAALRLVEPLYLGALGSKHFSTPTSLMHEDSIVCEMLLLNNGECHFGEETAMECVTRVGLAVVNDSLPRRCRESLFFQKEVVGAVVPSEDHAHSHRHSARQPVESLLQRLAMKARPRISQEQGGDVYEDSIYLGPVYRAPCAIYALDIGIPEAFFDIGDRLSHNLYHKLSDADRSLLDDYVRVFDFSPLTFPVKWNRLLKNTTRGGGGGGSPPCRDRFDCPLTTIVWDALFPTPLDGIEDSRVVEDFQWLQVVSGHSYFTLLEAPGGSALRSLSNTSTMHLNVQNTSSAPAAAEKDTMMSISADIERDILALHAELRRCKSLYATTKNSSSPAERKDASQTVKPKPMNAVNIFKERNKCIAHVMASFKNITAASKVTGAPQRRAAAATISPLSEEKDNIVTIPFTEFLSIGDDLRIPLVLASGSMPFLRHYSAYGGKALTSCHTCLQTFPKKLFDQVHTKMKAVVLSKDGGGMVDWQSFDRSEYLAVLQSMRQHARRFMTTKQMALRVLSATQPKATRVLVQCEHRSDMTCQALLHGLSSLSGMKLSVLPDSDNLDSFIEEYTANGVFRRGRSRETALTPSIHEIETFLAKKRSQAFQSDPFFVFPLPLTRARKLSLDRQLLSSRSARSRAFERFDLVILVTSSATLPNGTMSWLWGAVRESLPPSRRAIVDASPFGIDSVLMSRYCAVDGSAESGNADLGVSLGVGAVVFKRRYHPSE